MGGTGTEKNGNPAFYRTQNRGILVPMVDFAHPPTYAYEAGHSSLSNTKIQHEWRYSSTHAEHMDRENFILQQILSVMTGLSK